MGLQIWVSFIGSFYLHFISQWLCVSSILLNSHSRDMILFTIYFKIVLFILLTLPLNIDIFTHFLRLWPLTNLFIYKELQMTQIFTHEFRFCFLHNSIYYTHLNSTFYYRVSCSYLFLHITNCKNVWYTSPYYCKLPSNTM